jgi:hypothetical protein
MLCARDLRPYLLAVKSFLRFYDDLAVVIHEDGTVTEEDRAVLRNHLPGCRIIPSTVAREHAEKVLGRDSYLFHIRGVDCFYQRMIDTELWSKTKKRMIMDADVLVLRRPQEVVDWIHGEKPSFVMGQPNLNWSPDTPMPPPPQDAPVQSLFKYKLGEISDRLQAPKLFLEGGTGGFYGCTEELRLEQIERVARAFQDSGVPLDRWGSEQCAVIYLLTISGAFRLNHDYYFNYNPAFREKIGDAHLVHFFGLFRYHGGVYTRSASAVVRSLFVDS